MRFKVFLLILFFVFTIIGGINAKWRSSGRSRSGGGSRSGSYGSSSHRSSSHQSTNTGSSHGSYGSSPSHTSISHGPTSSVGHRPSGYETQARVNPVSHPIGSSSGPVTPQHSKDINTHFLSAEGGGAKRPDQTKPAGTSFGTWNPPVSSQNKPTAPAIQPTAPKEQVIRPTGTYQNQGSHVPQMPHPSTTGQTRPPWSNPYMGTHRANSSTQTHTPWSNPYMGTHRANSSTQTHTPWSNPYGSASPSSVPSQTNYPRNNSPVNPLAPSGYQPPPIGFKDHVYPQNHPTSMNSPYGQPQMGGHYPHSVPPSGPWSTHSYPPPNYHPSGMPMGNPYSLHPSGGAYHAPGQAYYPQQPQVLAQPASQPFVPGQTVIMVPGQQDSGRGFGQLVKEALVFSTINAGVNRLINPHTHYTASTPDSSSQPAATTHVTYNNQYFNTPPGVNGAPNPTPNVGAGNIPPSPLGYGNTFPTSIPNSGASSPVTGTVNGGGGNIGTVNGGGGNIGTGMTGNVAPPSTAQTNVASNQGNLSNNSNTIDNTPFYKISDDELFTITEDLFSKSLDISKYIKLNLQKRSTSSNVTDEATEPLFAIEPELMHYPSIYVTRALYDTYGHDFRKKMNRTLQVRQDENLLIDTFLNTNIMGRTMQWLADRGFIDPDDFERKDVLRRIWFTMFSGSTCGFERVFASENYDTAIIGVQDWIYFETEESKKRINYMGYVDELKFGNASLLKLNFDMDGIVRPNATIFVGTMPELEMSLYTICFFARPNNLCPVSLGGTKFNIYTHSFTYFGNEVIDLALPIF
ncbi:uncharacterized protein LOC143351790 isoform X2 [Colletes latitarsis]|uniref:uncharacterized protein LOC143351790 isoform X2 n=1 Tax=Colletes latitarsis TaxID=2605962 RepID=UPI0040353982